MVTLPKSYLIPSVNVKEDGKLYQAIDRIAIRPENTLRAPDALLKEATESNEFAKIEIAKHAATAEKINQGLHKAYRTLKEKTEALAVDIENENPKKSFGSRLKDTFSFSIPTIESIRLEQKNLSEYINEFSFKVRPHIDTIETLEEHVTEQLESLSEKVEATRKKYQPFGSMDRKKVTFNGLFDDFIGEAKLVLRENTHSVAVETEKELAAVEAYADEYGNFGKSKTSQSFKERNLDFIDKVKKGEYAINAKSAALSVSNFDSARLIKDAVTPINSDDIVQSEIIKKKLFFDALGVIAARHNIQLAPELLMNQQAGKNAENMSFGGSQDIILRANFESVIGQLSKKEDFFVGGTKTPSKYHFSFGFVGDNPESQALAKDTNFTQPVFLADDEALKTMEKAGVPQEKIQEYFKGFMKMAEMVEHDYLHTTLMPYIYSDKREKAFGYPPGEFLQGNPLEIHAKALHSDVLQELYSQNPKRKDAVLRWAAESFNLIADIQQTMLDKAATSAEIEEAHEVGTYLAYIYMDRFILAIPPNDKALYEDIKDIGSVVGAMKKTQTLLADGNSSERKSDRQVVTAEKLLEKKWNKRQIEREALIHGRETNVVITNRKKGWRSLLFSKTEHLGNVETYAAINEDARLGEPRHQTAGNIYKDMAAARDRKTASTSSDASYGKTKKDLTDARSVLREALSTTNAQKIIDERKKIADQKNQIT